MNVYVIIFNKYTFQLYDLPLRSQITMLPMAYLTYGSVCNILNFG